MSVPRIGIAIFVPASLALAAGIAIGVQSSQGQRESVELARLEEVAAEARLLTDSFWTAVELVRTDAQALARLRSLYPQGTTLKLPEPAGRILHWAEYDWSAQGASARVGALKQEARNAAWSAPAPALGQRPFIEEYLQSIPQRVSATDLKAGGISAFEVPQPQGAPSLLGMAFAQPGAQPASVLIALVDPATILGAFKKLDGTARAFLLGSKGRVLAHSRAAYVGADFSSTPVFSSGVRGMLQGTQPAKAGVYRSIDQLDVVSAFARPATLPLAIVVERLHSASSLSSGSWERLAGQGLISLGGLALATLLLTAWLAKSASGRVARAVQEASASAGASNEGAVPLSLTELSLPPLQAPASFVVPPPDSGAAGKYPSGASYAGGGSYELKSQLEASRTALRTARDEAQLLDQYEKAAAQLKDPKSVGYRLAETAHRLTGSPVLFFSFHEGLNSAILHADSGFAPGQGPSAMSFPLNGEAIRKVQTQTRTGETPSLADCEPLARLILARFGISHFEAWALTGFGPLGRLAGKPRVLGALVILHSGVESVSRHESLSRMLRSTGLIYENSILSQ
jgi:hypothetical protein